MSVARRTTMSMVVGIVLSGAAWWGASPARAAESPVEQARAILQATGVQGGLVVHVGCGDGQLTAALHANDRYLVHGLDASAANIDKARETIRKAGLYGKVSVCRLAGGKLPYVGNIVNLLVAEDLGAVKMAEVMRVLAPEGTAYVKQGGTWKKTVKPRPADIDEWSHFLHDAGGNAVARDKEVAPPRRLRWVSDPRWCRSHEFPSSVAAVVTAGGRVFMIFDEAPSGVYKKLPQACQVIAQDAANGVLLWKVSLQKWQPEDGTGEGNRWGIHHTIPRRLVADDERVYVTLAFLNAPVSVLDAATGKVLTRALPGTKGADEILLSEGVLIAKCTDKRSVAATARVSKAMLQDSLVAVDVRTGKMLWRKDHVRVLPYALSARAGRVVYHNMDELVCLDARTGKEAWREPLPTGPTQGGLSTLVITDGVVLFHGNTLVAQPAARAPAAKKPKKRRRGPGGRFLLSAFSLADGKRMWQHPGSRGRAAACTQPTDVFVTRGDVVWYGSALTGLDLKTGKAVKTLDVGKLISPGHHYRCLRSKATERFLIWPKRGAEFADTISDEHMRTDWVRGACFTGIMPANGLLYAPPDQCFCYPGVKVPGFLALSGKKAEKLTPQPASALERGPAYGKTDGSSSSGKPAAADWPMHRRDPQRSGATTCRVPVKLNDLWEVQLVSASSQPVVVGGKLWVAEKDAQRIRCLDAATGKDVWSFTADGRIDSAPTVYEDLVLFGCRDGCVYCLQAADGRLVWRYRAAPRRQTVSYGQIESVWPVSGSVLVQDGVVYFAAGRSSFLDGGILVAGLAVRTGKLLYHHVLEGPWPDVKTDTGRPFAMEGALPDLLVSDGKNLYMRRIKFDAKLHRIPCKRESDLGELDMHAPHLVATGGFLDGTGFDRLYWMHSHRWPGFYFSEFAPKSGQLVVFDDEATYAVKYFYRRIQWSPVFYPADRGYLLFADDIDNEPILEERGQPKRAIDWLPKESSSDRFRRGGRGVEKGTGYVRAKPTRWQKMIPQRVRAMLLARSTDGQGVLLTAGPPDVVDAKDPLGPFEGRGKMELHVYSTKDGTRLAHRSLPSAPAFDGMIAARGRVYIATQDGKVLCLGEKK